MLTFEDYSALAQVCDSTWGQSSTDATPTLSVKMNVTTADTAVVKYSTIVTYQGNADHTLINREQEIAVKAIDAYLKEVKKGFKALTGRSVRLKLVHVEPTIEIIDINTFSPLKAVKTVYFRCLGEVSVG